MSGKIEHRDLQIYQETALQQWKRAIWKQLETMCVLSRNNVCSQEVTRSKAFINLCSCILFSTVFSHICYWGSPKHCWVHRTSIN